MRPIIGLLLSLLTGCTPFLLRPSALEPLPADTSVRIGELENGLRYYIRENHEPRARAELRLVVNAGSVLEAEDQRGVAHFVEHMAFNGTTNFEKQALVDYLEHIGMRFGPDVNAYTSFDETVYLLTVPTDSAGVLDTGLQILEDWATGISFDSLEVEKERGVVIEEWRLGRGAGSRMQEKQLPVLLRGSRYADRLPIGTRESLQRFDIEAARRFYRDWYRPDLMAVVAVGDFDPDSMEAKIREQFSDIPPRGGPERRNFGVPEHDETLISVATDEEATAATVSLNTKREPSRWTTVADYRRWIVETLASSMINNRLTEYTQRPNSPFLDVSSFQGRFLRPVSAYVLTARVPPNGVERGMRELLREIVRVRQHGFTESELEREKTQLLRRAQQRYTERHRITSASFAADYTAHFLYGGTLVAAEDEYELYRRLVPGITLPMVNAVAKEWMRMANRVILVSMPESDTIRVPAEWRLESIVRTMERLRTTPYDDTQVDAPLLGYQPEPGPVVSERKYEELGIVEWELENGVRVLAKATDFREDEVLMVGRSPGGSSLVSDEDYLAALTAPAVVQAGGLGELSQTELRKLLAGKVAGVGVDLSEQHEGVSGAASLQDLETLLQLVHLKFVAPRLDSLAIEAYRQQARSTIALRSRDPDQVFVDSLRAILSQYHPRALPLTVEDFERLDVERSFEIYRDRFGDASDFTFYFVGSFEVDSLRPLVERYLGSLPSRGRTEKGRDTGVEPPSGVVTRTIRRGHESRARTQIVFTGPIEFERDRLYELDLLAGVLRIRLRETLREELSGTYGVSVGAGAVAEPRPRYQVGIAFGSEPERMTELTQAVFQVIDSLQTYGPTRNDFLKAKEMALRARQTDLRTNRFWIERMLSYDQHDWPLEGILDLPEWLDRASEETIRRAARMFLDGGRYVQVTLLPEGSAPADTVEGVAGTELRR
ncbi:MAG TPA: insulinase family protein [Longimicrobiaceae bacterium]